LQYSDGIRRSFFMKVESKVETKVEENTMDMIIFFNSILKKKFNFQMNSYSIIALCRNIGIMKWLDKTSSLKGIYNIKKLYI
jgi:phosphatidylinositol kinase/protein kinase (PI-3  family)